MDEYGIPTGDYKLACGCQMRGRGLLWACDEHRELIYFGIDSLDFSKKE